MDIRLATDPRRTTPVDAETSASCSTSRLTFFKKDDAMSLFRFNRSVCWEDAYGAIFGGPRRGRGMIEVGDVLEVPPTVGYGVFPKDIEQLPDPRDDGQLATMADILSGCDRLLEWMHAGYLSNNFSLFRHVIAQRLRQLSEAYVMMPDTPPLSFDASKAAAAHNMSSLVNMVKSFRQGIGSLGKRHAEVTGQLEETSESGSGRRPRGRPRGSDSAANDLKLYLDWKAANRTTGITKSEFLRERGLLATDIDAIERGRAHEKRMRSEGLDKNSWTKTCQALLN